LSGKKKTRGTRGKILGVVWGKTTDVEWGKLSFKGEFWMLQNAGLVGW